MIERPTRLTSIAAEMQASQLMHGIAHVSDYVSALPLPPKSTDSRPQWYEVHHEISGTDCDLKSCIKWKIADQETGTMQDLIETPIFMINGFRVPSNQPEDMTGLARFLLLQSVVTDNLHAILDAVRTHQRLRPRSAPLIRWEGHTISCIPDHELTPQWYYSEDSAHAKRRSITFDHVVSMFETLLMARLNAHKALLKHFDLRR